MKITTKILSTILCGIFSLTFCACQNATSEKSGDSELSGSINSNHTSIDSGDDYFASGDVNRLPSLKTCYPSGETSSMVLAELESVGEVLSNDPSVSAIYSDYLMVEFRIIEDYYQKLSENTIITVPVELNILNILNESVKAANLFDGEEENIAKAHSINDIEDDAENELMSPDSTGNMENERETLNAEILSEFLNENKQAILYFRFVYESERWYRNRDWKDAVTFNCISCGIRLPENYIPVNNGIVECNAVLNFLDENNCSYNSLNDIYNFSSFIYDGMSLSAAKENICELYRSQSDESDK